MKTKSFVFFIATACLLFTAWKVQASEVNIVRISVTCKTKKLNGEERKEHTTISPGGVFSFSYGDIPSDRLLVTFRWSRNKQPILLLQDLRDPARKACMPRVTAPRGSCHFVILDDQQTKPSVKQRIQRLCSRKRSRIYLENNKGETEVQFPYYDGGFATYLTIENPRNENALVPH